MSTNWVTFTATIPEWGLPELSRHAADVVARAVATDGGDIRFSQAAVHRAYAGGNSADWQAFLTVLAHESLAAKDGWVEWQVLCDRVGISARKASGVLGAAERRLNRQPPFERTHMRGKQWFRMPRAVAEWVIQLAQDVPA